MADRERDAAWFRLPESASRAAVIRTLNEKLRLRAQELLRLQDRVDGLKGRVTTLEGP